MKQTLERIRAEFLEMPGLRLSVVQMQRLCGVEGVMCQAVLDALVDLKFLRVNADGTYSRLTDLDASQPQPRRAESSPPSSKPRKTS